MRKVIITVIGTIVTLIILSGVALGVTAYVKRPSPSSTTHSPTSTVAPPRVSTKIIIRHKTVAVPAPQPSAPVAPVTPAEPGVPASYAQDITNAGIVAPIGWINKTGVTLCADWASGMSVAQTDSTVLGPGGILPQHFALYDSITQQDLCL
jgi:hypothetical protein